MSRASKKTKDFDASRRIKRRPIDGVLCYVTLKLPLKDETCIGTYRGDSKVRPGMGWVEIPASQAGWFLGYDPIIQKNGNLILSWPLENIEGFSDIDKDEYRKQKELFERNELR